MWIDPDAEKRGEEEAGGRKIKFLLRFDIQETGSFEMAVSVQERKVKMGLSVPPALMDQKQEIQKKMTEIFQMCIRDRSKDHELTGSGEKDVQVR